MSEPRNVDDVPYVESADGASRPMLEVLAERKRRARESPRAVREAAFRERAGMIAILQGCSCNYPLVKAETSSEHEEWCDGHLWTLSMKRTKENHRP